MSRLSDHERSTGTVTLAAEQFDKLVELLTPGYQLAQVYLAQQNSPAKDESPAKAEAPASDTTG